MQYARSHGNSCCLMPDPNRHPLSALQRAGAAAAGRPATRSMRTHTLHAASARSKALVIVGSPCTQPGRVRQQWLAEARPAPHCSTTDRRTQARAIGAAADRILRAPHTCSARCEPALALGPHAHQHARTPMAAAGARFKTPTPTLSQTPTPSHTQKHASWQQQHPSQTVAVVSTCKGYNQARMHAARSTWCTHAIRCPARISASSSCEPKQAA